MFQACWLPFALQKYYTKCINRLYQNVFDEQESVAHLASWILIRRLQYQNVLRHFVNDSPEARFFYYIF